MLKKLLRRVRGKVDAPSGDSGQRRGFRGDDAAGAAAAAAEQSGRAGGSFASDAKAAARPTAERDTADGKPAPSDS